MKESPIVFNSQMVQAILAGNKTQTRQVVTPQPDPDGLSKLIDGPWQDTNEKDYKCPYGHTGDRLWVREPWQVWTEFNDTNANNLPQEARENINFPANGIIWDARKRPPVHMPRWASRITLEITGVRVERLQDISERDAKAEGMKPETNNSRHMHRSLFRKLWNNRAKRGWGWDVNPWVWVIKFKRVD